MNGFNRQDAPEYNIPKSLDYATACALLIRREVLEATNGFDTDMDFAIEDYDFCYRVRRAGFKIGYVPNAVIRHKVSQSLAGYSRRRWQHYGKNTVLFYRKGERFPLRWLLTIVVWVSLREAFKGHFRLLPGYWKGIQEGFKALTAINSRGTA
jgi:GT2 family glycosyltransferase